MMIQSFLFLAANNSYSVAPTVTALTTTEFSGSDVCVDCSVDLYGLHLREILNT